MSAPRVHYAADGVTVYHADALALCRALPDASVDLVATDPPYFRVKDEAWDRAWHDADAFLAWFGALCDEWRRVLKPNGSLYVFASPDMVGSVEREVAARFRVLNVARWYKEDGWHKKAEKETLRAFLSPWEGCVFAEQFDCEYEEAARVLHMAVFAPIGRYLAGARESAGLSANDTDVALGYVRRKNAQRGTELCRRWEEGSSLPTSADYGRLRGLYGAAHLARPYSELVDEAARLRRDFEAHRRAYDALRRPFALTPRAQWSDLWTFATVPPYPGKHACEKPVALMEHIVAASSRPGAVVFDPFCGSGTTALAARNLGRRAIVGDASAHWCAYTRDRLAQGSLFGQEAA